MKRTALLLCMAAAVTSTMVACKKDSSNDGGSTAVDGTWNVVSLAANTRVTVTAQGVSQTSTSQYASTKVSGTVTMVNGNFASNIGYTVEGTVSSVDPESGETVSLPLTFSLAPTASKGTYKVIGDSLYTSGAFVDPNDAQAAGAVATTGGKFKFVGDTLVLTATGAKTQAVSQGGVTGTSSYWISNITKMVKK